MINNNNLHLRNLGILNINGTCFESKNNHNFVFRKSNKKLEYFGENIQNFPSHEINLNTKLYQNHDAFCLLYLTKYENKSLTCFGNPDYGGVIPSDLSDIYTKNIINIFSTNSAFCALTNNKNIYVWGNELNGGKIPDSHKVKINNNVEKIFSNKDTFLIVYGENKKLLSWGAISMPKELENLTDVKTVYSNDNSFIILYKYSFSLGVTTRLKCFSRNPKFELNKNNVESLNNIKVIYSNGESFLVIYGNTNKVHICGNNKFLGDLVSEYQNLENIIDVVTTNGAYCLLDNKGNIYIYGIKEYIQNAPEQSKRTNIKKIYSNYGVFIAVNNKNIAYIWGLSTHGYVENNNVILNTKDVYVNGDENGGSVLIVKNGSDNLVCVGNSNYGGSNIIIINSLSVKNIYPAINTFFYENNENKILAINNINQINNYNFNKIYKKDDSKIYSNNFDKNKYEEISNLSPIINTPNIPILISLESNLQNNSVIDTQNNKINTNLTIEYYYWLFDNTTNNFTNNINDIKWNIQTQNLEYTYVENIMAKINKNKESIIFNNKNFAGNNLSLSFKLQINDISKTFIIFSMFNMMLLHDKGILKLFINNKIERTLMVDNNVNLLSFTFSSNNGIKIYKNNSKINYDNNLNFNGENLDTYNLIFGKNNYYNQYSDLPDFNLSSLLIMENYEFTSNDIINLNNGLQNFIDIFDKNNLDNIFTTKVINTKESSFNKIQSNNSKNNTVIMKNEDLIENLNYLTISPKFNSLNFKQKIMSNESFTSEFADAQIQNNLSILNDFKNNLITNNISYNLPNYMNLTKVDKIDYRGLRFTEKTYYGEKDGILFILFNVNNNSINNLLKLKYLNLDKIKEIYEKNSDFGNIYMFITGVKTEKTDQIFQSKNNIYFLVYNDKDLIKRYVQIEVDLEFFFKIFNFEFMKFYIQQNFPDTLDDNNILTFYENLETIEHERNNIKKNYVNSLINTENKELVESVLVNVFKNKKNTNIINIFNSNIEENNKCLYIPSGNTLYECKQLCVNNLNINCNEEECNNICKTCYSDACKWNYSKKKINESLKPLKAKIKGFSGNKYAKITWLKPESKSEITKYYIIVTSPINNDFIEIYSFYDSRELPEYIINNLENDLPYSISLVSKNKIGVSDVSNIETIIPNEFSTLDNYESKNSYDNSLQNIKSSNENILNISNQKSMYEKQNIIQELKYILVNKLKFKTPIGAYNINVY